jgi:hypothetical protein
MEFRRYDGDKSWPVNISLEYHVVELKMDEFKLWYEVQYFLENTDILWKDPEPFRVDWL